MNKRKSKKLFTRTAGIKSKNRTRSPIARGGIRL